MKTTIVAAACAVGLLGCHQSRPVTYTSAAIYSVTCAALGGAGLLGAKPSKLVVVVDAELSVAASGEMGRSVTPVAGKAEGAGAHTARVEMEIDPATVKCDSKEKSQRFWLNSETGELTAAPP